MSETLGSVPVTQPIVRKCLSALSVCLGRSARLVLKRALEGQSRGGEAVWGALQNSGSVGHGKIIIFKTPSLLFEQFSFPLRAIAVIAFRVSAVTLFSPDWHI